MQSVLRFLDRGQTLALTLLRAVMGVILGHAGQLKVFKGDLAVSAFGDLGIPMPQVLGPFVSVLELAGGLALFLGLFTRLLGVLFAVEFVVASLLIVQVRGLMGARLEYLLVAGAIVLATRGAGALALDRPHHPWEP